MLVGYFGRVTHRIHLDYLCVGAAYTHSTTFSNVFSDGISVVLVLVLVLVELIFELTALRHCQVSVIMSRLAVIKYTGLTCLLE